MESHRHTAHRTDGKQSQTDDRGTWKIQGWRGKPGRQAAKDKQISANHKLNGGRKNKQGNGTGSDPFAASSLKMRWVS